MNLTLSDRENRLRLFLVALLPQWRVVPSLRPHREAVRIDTLHLPEMRLLPGGERDGILRWKLELAAGHLVHPEERRMAILHATETLRGALDDSPWQARGGEPSTVGSLADLWVETIEEATTPAGHIPQTFFQRATEHALWNDLNAAAGATTLPMANLASGTITTGDHLLLQSASQTQYLGMAQEAETGYRFEYPLQRAFTGGCVLYRLAEGFRLSEAAAEKTISEAHPTRRVYTTLSGKRHVRVLGASWESERWQLSIAPRNEIDTWRTVLGEMLSSPSVIATSRRGECFEVTVRRLETGGRGITLQLDTRPLLDLAPFLEA